MTDAAALVGIGDLAVFQLIHGFEGRGDAGAEGRGLAPDPQPGEIEGKAERRDINVVRTPHCPALAVAHCLSPPRAVD